MTQSLPTTLAYYGKLPARGDFVGRRLARETIGLWDDWLQQSIARSREAVGAQWLDLYLVSPLWRFVLPAGLCGRTALAGVMMPSVDKVGRAFPLMLAAELADLEPAAVLAGGQGWFSAIEDLALAALAEDFALEQLDAPLAAFAPGAVPAVRSAELGPIGLAMPWGGADDTRTLAEYGQGSDRSLWWTLGSERVSPVLVLARGLPAPDGFAAFLDGDWARHDWSLAAAPDGPMPDGAISEGTAPDAGTSGASSALEAELLPWDREE
ncbi:type VI secretion-associated protein [Aliidongia dinghuensis]|uniref:Type VI secretion-associated protein n=1 Tax=Aliidongia dinghuensis TaxID=1867774 RepID=A0A8J2YR72_9PROT|nr:type VI secretion system-associated protein TagF [Aliidongia dinghuensis]GGF11136.1 type VI secretion-associated protein [Aliidongia dinghuensis]